MAEITDFLSPKAVEQIDGYLKSLTAINEKYIQLAKTYDTISAKTGEAINNEKELEKLNQAKIKTDSDLIKLEALKTKEAEKAAKQQEKNIENARKEQSAYNQLNKEYKESLQRTRDLTVQYGANSKAAKESAEKTNKLGKEIEKVNKATNMKPGANNVGRYFKDIMQAGVAMIGITGGIQLLSKGFEALKNSSQAFGGAFAIKMEQVNFVTGKFFSMLGTGQLENFWQNLQKAADAGKSYAQAMDDMFEGGLGLKIAESEARLLIAEQEKIRDNELLTKEERIAAAKEINRIENGLTANRLAETQAAYDAEKQRMNDLVGINEQEFISFLKTFRAKSGLRDEVVKKIEAEKQAEEALELARKMANYNLPTEIEKVYNDRLIIAQNAYSDEEKIYKDYLNRYSGLSDEMIQKTAETYASITDVKAQEIEDTKKNNIKLNKFIKELADENKKKKEDEQKKNKEIKDSNEKLGEDILKGIIKRGEDEKKQKEAALQANKKYLAKKKAQQQASAEATRLIAEDEYQTEKSKFDKMEQDAIDYYDKIEEELNFRATHRKVNFFDTYFGMNGEQQEKYKQQSIELANTLFSLQQSRLDREMSSLESYYELRINAQQELGKDTTKLEREYANKKAEIQRKQAKSEQNQALFNIAIQTAENIVSAKMNPYLIALAVAIGLAQTAAVKSQPLPEVAAYAKGTDDAASVFIAGEEGRELMMLSDGTFELTKDRATLYKGKKYQHAEIFPHAETQQILANNQMSGMSTAGIERKLDRLIAKDEKPVINIINKYNQRFEKRYERMRK